MLVEELRDRIRDLQHECAAWKALSRYHKSQLPPPKPERSTAVGLQAILSSLETSCRRSDLRYEIPLDSRIVRWLSDLGVSLRLSPIGLLDESYYSCVMDETQRFCEQASLPPCVFDSAILSDFEAGSGRGSKPSSDPGEFTL